MHETNLDAVTYNKVTLKKDTETEPQPKSKWRKETKVANKENIDDLENDERAQPTASIRAQATAGENSKTNSRQSEPKGCDQGYTVTFLATNTDEVGSG